MPFTALSLDPSPAGPGPDPGEHGREPLLLEVEGMRCGGCVRSVERSLEQLPSVRQASVNLLSRTVWVDPEPQLDPQAEDPLATMVSTLAAMGFRARLRAEDPSVAPPPVGEVGSLHRWDRWRGLLAPLVLLLLSGAGHLWVVPSWIRALVATVALAGPGRAIVVPGWRSARSGLPGMDTLVGLGMGSAYLSSLVGWLWPASGWPCCFEEPVMLLGFVLIGRFLEERARHRTGRAIEQLAALQPDHALLLLGDGPARPVRVGTLRPGDHLQLLPGDRLPVDGVVLRGASLVDSSALTGESIPRQAGPGQELAAGTLNLDAALVLEVRRAGAESAIARIVRLVEQAQASKAPVQAMADRLAGRFVMVVLVLATGTFLFWWLWGAAHWRSLPGGDALAGTPMALALQLAIAVLVVACPCALGLATPTAMAVGAGQAARQGLLFRSGAAIETAAGLHTVLFDKTGTLTRGRARVSAVVPVNGSNPDDCDRLLLRAASLSRHSRHPLAAALLDEAARRNLMLLRVVDGRSIAGEGLQGRLEGDDALIRVGRPSWLERQGVAVGGSIAAPPPGVAVEGASLVAVAEADRLLGWVALCDLPRADAAETVAALREMDLDLGLLSGDRRSAVVGLAGAIGLRAEELAWNLSPARKIEAVQSRRGLGPVAMVGDGINDAPALAAADLGVAVATGTQIAQESADLILLGEQLGALVRAIVISRATMSKVRQNLLWAFGYNLIALPLAAGLLLPRFGLMLTPSFAGLLMALSSITVVANALLLQLETGEPRGIA